ncbi:MAG: monofunctional biosynthetic peptidoglycan transglycosylase [Fibrobacter sp.]|jgi:monofunctional biosynthetic peptidoglycan transglycosylase|nr:monofunctional biosynthetic peptidoglycan transglycosylase [Fibrobacter sp.]
MLQKISIIARIFVIVLFIYSVLFSIVGTIFVIKAQSYIFGAIDEIHAMRESEPQMSRFMQDLLDSNPKVQIKQTFVPLDSISKKLQFAVIAVEDPSFYFHPGFDIRGIASAVDANMSSGKLRYGGSTITQQLAKNLFLTGERTWERKARELGYALLMEYDLGKKRILELYLNYAQWGKDVFGCEAASEAYYGVHCSELDDTQAVNLAAMLVAPCKYKPESEDSTMVHRRKLIAQNIKYVKEPASDSSER